MLNRILHQRQELLLVVGVAREKLTRAVDRTFNFLSRPLAVGSDAEGVGLGMNDLLTHNELRRGCKML